MPRPDPTPFRRSRILPALLCLAIPLVLGGCNEPGAEQEDDLDEVRLGTMDFESFGGMASSRFELSGVATLSPPDADGASPIVDLTMEGEVQGQPVRFELRGALLDEPGQLAPQRPHPLEQDATLASLQEWSNPQPVIQFVPGSLFVNAFPNEVFVPLGQTDLFLLRYWHPQDEGGTGELGMGGLVQFRGVVPAELTETGASFDTGNVMSAQFVLRVPMTCAELSC